MCRESTSKKLVVEDSRSFFQRHNPFQAQPNHSIRLMCSFKDFIFAFAEANDTSAVKDELQIYDQKSLNLCTKLSLDDLNK